MTTDVLAGRQIAALGTLGGDRARSLCRRLASEMGTESPRLLALTREAKALLEMNGLSVSTKAATTDKPWDGSASRFSDEQYQRSCALDRKACGDSGPPKERCSLPIREPDGTLNSNAVHQAAAALGGARGGVRACPAAIAAAKRAVRGAYGTLGETPPSGLGS